MKRVPLFAALIALAAAPVAAQALRDCDTFEANARNIYGPYDETIREYANGAIRVIALDTSEPACCSYHLMVTHPHPEEPYLLCSLVSRDEQLGYGALYMHQIGAEYDPATGLTVTVPAGHWDGTSMAPEQIVLTVNQATGTVTAGSPAPAPAPVPVPEDGK